MRVNCEPCKSLRTLTANPVPIPQNVFFASDVPVMPNEHSPGLLTEMSSDFAETAKPFPQNCESLRYPAASTAPATNSG